MNKDRLRAVRLLTYCRAAVSKVSTSFRFTVEFFAFDELGRGALRFGARAGFEGPA